MRGVYFDAVQSTYSMNLSHNNLQIGPALYHKKPGAEGVARGAENETTKD